jgi:hypothetical protein
MASKTNYEKGGIKHYRTSLLKDMILMVRKSVSSFMVKQK